MAEESKKPLWLDLKKEYIDDNFEKLITYLSDNSAAGAAGRDSFYDTTIQLLIKRVEYFLNEKAGCAIYEDESSTEDRTFGIRLLATYLLVGCGSAIQQSVVHVAFLAELARVASPQFVPQLLAIVFRRLRAERVTNLGFTWADIAAHDIMADTLAFKAINCLDLSSSATAAYVLEEHGLTVMDSTGLHLVDQNLNDYRQKTRQQSASLTIGENCVEVLTDKGNQLKKSEENNVMAMENFTLDFIKRQREVRKKRKTYLQYGDDELVDLRVVDIRGGHIIVETMDPRYIKLQGFLDNKPSLLYYYTDSFADIFRIGDTFDAHIKSVDDRTFTIDRTFVRYIVKYSSPQLGTYCVGKLIDTRKGRHVWLTEDGAPVYTDQDDGYVKNDYATLLIRDYGQGNSFGMIFGDIIDHASADSFVEAEVRHRCVRGYVYDKAPSYPDDSTADKALPPMLLGILLRQIYHYQKSLVSPSERYRNLCVARIMAEMIGDSNAASYIEFNAAYLHVLVQFALGQTIDSQLRTPEGIDPNSISVLERRSVVQILSEYGRAEISDSLDEAAQSHPMPLIKKLASLVESANRIIPYISEGLLSVIRREIIKTLAVETEQATDLEADSGIYMGVESGMQEFKTSFVYPSGNNMQAEPTTQRHNVFKGLCAFLNSTTGGTLYLGVNDAGYVCGLENDFSYLHIQDIDTYIRHIQDEAKKAFGLDVLTNITISPMYDNQVVAIKVEPYEYGVVHHENKAYIRVNNESREMNESVIQQQLDRKVFRNHGKVANISSLHRAIESKRRVIFHGYSSSNSGSVEDRTVEAYEVFPMHNLVAALDLRDNKCKVFSLSRIGNVEITDESWKMQISHKKIQVDAFHMTGEKPIEVQLQLDLMAKNLLVEEFPAAASDIKPNANDRNIWYYDARVFNIAGIGRFYIGLANHIQILNSPELQTYAEKFAHEHILNN